MFKPLGFIKGVAYSALATLALVSCTSSGQKGAPSLEAEVLHTLRTLAPAAGSPDPKPLKADQELAEEVENLVQEQEAAARSQTFTLASYGVSSNKTFNTQLNLFHRNFNGGIGTLFTDQGEVHYASGATNFPLGEDVDATLLFHILDDKRDTDKDAATIQGALDIGSWSIGGGLLNFAGDDNDVGFGRVLHKSTTGNLDYLVGGFVKTTSDGLQPGISAVLSLKDIAGFNLTGGIQYEETQTRYTAGILFPKLDEAINLQPSADLLRVDNENGSSFTLTNVTLGYKGKFFAPNARIGRLLGATGVWHHNPIYGTDPSARHNLNWNRLGATPMIGDLATVQFFQVEAPNGEKKQHLDALVFPFQFDSSSSVLDNIFVGWSYDSFGDGRKDGPMIGARYRSGSFSGNINCSLYGSDPRIVISALVTF